MRRVFVTGMGLLSPIGNSVTESWDSAIHGRSGIERVEAFEKFESPDGPLRVQIGGAVKNFDPLAYGIERKDQKRMARFIQLAMAAGREAWAQSGLPERLEGEQAARAGCILGTGMVGLERLTDAIETIKTRGAKRVSPYLIPAFIPNLGPGQLAMKYGLEGTNWVLNSACASSSHAIGESFLNIRSGISDVILTGGAEAALHPITVAGFDAMHALCRKWQDEPALASRPFDKERCGFVMGEGAGILVLESEVHAKKRGATVLAEIIGYGSSCDAHHLTAPAENGLGAQKAMRAALKMAGILGSEVGYINAHGTSTKINDLSESQAIAEVFGQFAGNIPISSTKSMTGHLFGAAGATEQILSICAMNSALLPPTINLSQSDIGLDLDYIRRPREVPTFISMNNSFGFGGTNACLLARANDLEPK